MANGWTGMASPYFWLDFNGRMGFNTRMTKLLASTLAAALLLCACGPCNSCGSYNSDYLRDVPTVRTQSF